MGVNENRVNIRSEQNRRRKKRFHFCVNLLIIAITITGFTLGVYGIVLIREAKDSIAASNGHIIPPLEAENDDWSLLISRGLRYEELHPIDIECERAFIESDERGDAHARSTIWEYGDKWKEEMEKYLDLLTLELDENGVLWEVGFEQIEVARGGFGFEVAVSQEKWEEFRISAERLDDFIRYQINHAGTMMSDYRAIFRYDTYRARALYLKSLYDFLTLQ